MSPRWCLLLLISPSLWAQDPSPPSLPVRALDQAESAGSKSSPDVLALADIERLIAAEQGRLGVLSQTSTVGAKVELSPPALPPGEMQVIEGKTLAIPIGMGQINRLRTPFREFRVLHQSTATLKKQGPSLYVTPLDNQPFAVYLEDKLPPHGTIGLLLRPHGALPPVQIQLTLSGTSANMSAPPTGGVEPHVARLRQTLRTIAQGNKPDGFIKRLPRSDDPAFGCATPGLAIQRDHVVEGSDTLVLVSHLTNQSAVTVEINEPDCAEPGLLAVAAFPDLALPPGGQTALMQVYRRTTNPSSGAP